MTAGDKIIDMFNRRWVMQALAMLPPELAADIYNTGIYLAGGGSMLRGLEKRISAKTDLAVFIAEDPLKSC